MSFSSDRGGAISSCYVLIALCDPNREAGAIILKVAYGYEIEAHKEDPLVTLADHAMDQFSKAMIPGAWLVDMVPIRKCRLAIARNRVFGRPLSACCS